MEEKKRYELHNNDVQDPGYRKFVSPLVQYILQKKKSWHVGLDYGSGSAPVISEMLRENGFTITTYDPYFESDGILPETRFEYILCCEVMEHFYHPQREFEYLSKLLKPNGCLVCKTALYDPKTNFGSWWYKNDPTHVFFYTQSTLEWIQTTFGFKKLTMEKDFFIFEKDSN